MATLLGTAVGAAGHLRLQTNPEDNDFRILQSTKLEWHSDCNGIAIT